MHPPLRPTVLLVQPEDDAREMYAEYLELCGFTPLPLATGGDALLRAADADVVVTGIHLPGWSNDGIELVSRLRTDARTKNKAIIVLTACVSDADHQRAIAAGSDGFLPKPCVPDILVAEIRRVLSLRQAKPDAARAASSKPSAQHRRREPQC